MAQRCGRWLGLVVAAVAAFGVMSSTAQAAGSIWTPLPSGTNQAISAIAAPKAGEVVFSTDNGQIFHLSGTSFVASAVTSPPVLGFSRLAMSPDGSHGIAVGPNGKIFYSADAGASWAPIATVPTEVNGTVAGQGSCGDDGVLGPLSDNLISVRYADANTVYITGSHADILKSTDAGSSGSPTFTEVNKALSAGTITCKADPGGESQYFGDTAWINANSGFLLSNSFGDFFLTNDGLGAAGNTAKQPTGAVNGFETTDRLAIDQADSTHMWVINAGTGGSYFSYTTNTGSTWNTPTYDDNNQGFTDIAAANSTVVAVGVGGDIYTSGDGLHFYRQVAAAPLNTNGWQAVALVPGTSTAFVGGSGGALITTTKANLAPDTTAPTGSITGPKTLVKGQAGTFTAHVSDNPGGSGIDPSSLSWSSGSQTATGPTASFTFPTPGTYTITLSFKDLAGNTGSASYTVKVPAHSPSSGSSPVTVSAGGATIVIDRTVTVTGRSPRFIPVKVSDSSPRRFVVALKSSGKPATTLSSTSLTLRHGTARIHLKVPGAVKSGHYVLSVSVFTTGRHGHKVGTVRQTVVLV